MEHKYNFYGELLKNNETIEDLERQMNQSMSLFRRDGCCEATIIQAEAAFEQMKGLCKTALVHVWELELQNTKLMRELNNSQKISINVEIES